MISYVFTVDPPGQTSFALLPSHSLAPVAEDALWLYVLHALSYLRTIHDAQRKCGDEQSNMATTPWLLATFGDSGSLRHDGPS